MAGTRVVMLVDNSVDGDSRVQKSAREMASLGWDVTLIGRSPTTARRQYALGDATVLLLPVNTPAAFHWNPRFRSWRHPLAYADAASADRAGRAQQWRRMDLQARRGAGSSSRSLLPARIWLKLRGLWHAVRSRQTAHAREHHQAGATPLAVHGSRQWRWDEPMLADMDVVMGTEIASITPDLIHAHDFRSLPTAVRAADRMSVRGRRPKVVYDAHEYLPGIVMARPRSLRGSVQAEAESIGGADSIITVSDGVADLLVTAHGLAERPLVVANAPMRWRPSANPAARTVRSEFGLDESLPVFVYLGNASAARGIATVVDGLERLPDARLVMLTRKNAYLTSLLASARERGFADRIIVRDYVDPDEVSPYISTATASLIPYLSEGGQINHEVALPNKLFEAIQAGIPVVVSDMRSASEFVREHGVGSTFTGSDVDSFVEAATEVIRDQAQFRRRIAQSGLQEEYSWQAQCAPVDDVYRRLLGTGPDPRRAALSRAIASLDSGVSPPEADLRAAASLAVESLAAAPDAKSRAQRLAVAEQVLFHRTLHFDGVSSPLADDPGGHLTGWVDTPPLPALGSQVRLRPAAPLPQRPRVAVVGYVNLSWAAGVVDALSAAGASVRVVDLADPDVHGPISDGQLRQLALGAPPARLAEAVRSIIDDSDAVWVEWAERAAVAMTAVDPGTTRMIVRLHSYEAFKPALHYVRWGHVDDLVFVTPHYRDLVGAMLGGRDGYDRVRTHVIPTWTDDSLLALPKLEGARHTLALLGWAAPAKDAGWALDLLTALRERDDRYRLLLWGNGNRPDAAPGVLAYEAAVLRRVEDLGLGGAVEFRGHTDDVAAALTEVGVIVSSSVREGSHTALAEGALSAAVPVVRDWPLVARWNGPRRLYPPEWVVADVEQATARVLALTADDTVWREAGGSAQEQARARFGLAAGRAAVAAVLGGG